MSEPAKLGEILTPMIQSSSKALSSGNCSKCGQPRQVLKEVVFGKEREIPLRCDCEIQEYNAKLKAMQDRDRQRRMESLFRDTEMSVNGLTFDNFKTIPGTQAAVDVMKAYAKALKSGKWLYLYGTYGNGKSHLAEAVARARIRQLRPVVFISVPRLFTKLEASRRFKNRSKEELIESMARADLVVLDDFARKDLVGSKVYAWDEDQEYDMFALLNTLYRQGVDVLITSNVGFKELQSVIGGRLFDRLLEKATVVENIAPSYRKRIAAGRRERREYID